jgi:anaerobic selenocysteine-containing dehydrogenase
VHVLNSAFQHAEKVINRHPIAPIFMNPADIAQKGLEPGETIEILSSTGRIVGQLTADVEMRPGVVSMPHNWGKARPGNGQTSLTSVLVSLDEAIEPINFMPRQSAIPVNVRRRAAAL